MQNHSVMKIVAFSYLLGTLLYKIHQKLDNFLPFQTTKNKVPNFHRRKHHEAKLQ